MSMKLVIVESPSKSKTIEKYLGKDYKVVSSLGHIRDLSTSGKYGFNHNNNYYRLYILNEEYNITYEKAKRDYVLVIPSDIARKKVFELKRMINDLGVVNIGSIEEYERVKKWQSEITDPGFENVEIYCEFFCDEDDE